MQRLQGEYTAVCSKILQRPMVLAHVTVGTESMARHYSTRDFFRQIPNALLARYFEARGLFGDLDFTSMKETQPDALFAAWLALSDTQRNQMDAELRDIFALGCEKGLRAIIDEAEWHMANDSPARTVFVEKLAAREAPGALLPPGRKRRSSRYAQASSRLESSPLRGHCIRRDLPAPPSTLSTSSLEHPADEEL